MTKEGFLRSPQNQEVDAWSYPKFLSQDSPKHTVAPVELYLVCSSFCPLEGEGLVQRLPYKSTFVHTHRTVGSPKPSSDLNRIVCRLKTGFQGHMKKKVRWDPNLSCLSRKKNSSSPWEIQQPQWGILCNRECHWPGWALPLIMEPTVFSWITKEVLHVIPRN